MNTEKAVVVKEKTVADNVLAKVELFKKTGELVVPDNYSPANAIKAAWMYLQEAVDKDGKPVLQVCTQNSIANALFTMIIDGLSVAKKQVYFIAYGKKLNYQISYFGNLAKAKRICGVKSVNGVVVYDGDKKDFKYQVNPDTGIMKVISHTPKLENIDNNKIAGAYAVVIFEDGRTKTEIMTMQQIKQAWMQGKAKGGSPAHKNFPDQMAIRTVINRAVKIELSSSDDSYLGIENKQPEAKTEDVKTIDMEAEIVEAKTEEVEETAKTNVSTNENPESAKDDKPEF